MCRSERAQLNQLNQRLLAANPEVIDSGAATSAALRHIPANATGFTFRTQPFTCDESQQLGAPCVGGGGKDSFWSSAGGIVAAIAIALAALALVLLIVLCVRKRLKKEYGLGEHSADVSKSPPTVQIEDKGMEGNGRLLSNEAANGADATATVTIKRQNSAVDENGNARVRRCLCLRKPAVAAAASLASLAG